MVKNVAMRKILIALAIGVFAALISIFAFNAVYKNSRLGEVYFLNYSLKNMNHKDVEYFVSDKIKPLVNKYKINVHFEEKSFNVNLKDIGGNFNADDIFKFGKSKDVNEKDMPMLKFNEKKLEEIIKYFSEKTKIEPTKFKYKKEEDKLKVKSGSTGKQIDVKKTVDIIKDFLHSSEFIECLKNGSFKSINAEVQELVQDISTINLEEIKKDVDSPVKDASLSIVNGERVCEKEKQGVNLDLSKAKQIVNNPKKGEYTLPLQTKNPTKTTKDIENNIAKNIKTPDTLGVCTTYFSNSKKESVRNRNENIKLAAAAINGTILLPGEEFSFGKKAGSLPGYKDAVVYRDGKVYMGKGGGICQNSSTLFNAATSSGLDITKRTSHTRPVDYLTPGKDASFDSGGTDFGFKNSLSNPIKIVMTTTNNSVTVKILGINEGYKGKLQSEIVSESNNIRKVVTKYTVTKDGKVVKTKTFNSTYNTKKETESAPATPATIATPNTTPEAANKLQPPSPQPNPNSTKPDNNNQTNAPSAPPTTANNAPAAQAPQQNQSATQPPATATQPNNKPDNNSQTNAPAVPPTIVNNTPAAQTQHQSQSATQPTTSQPKKEDIVPKISAPTTPPLNLPNAPTAPSAVPPMQQKIGAPIPVAP